MFKKLRQLSNIWTVYSTLREAGLSPEKSARIVQAIFQLRSQQRVQQIVLEDSQVAPSPVVRRLPG